LDGKGWVVMQDCKTLKFAFSDFEGSEHRCGEISTNRLIESPKIHFRRLCTKYK
jgi:hypothetical protein